MSNIERIARQIATDGLTPKLMEELRKTLKETDTPAADRYRALEKWAEDGECEIDDTAVVSISESGAYVQARVWVGRK